MDIAMDNINFVEYSNETVGVNYYGNEIDGYTLSADGMNEVYEDGILELGVADWYEEEEEDDAEEEDEEE